MIPSVKHEVCVAGDRRLEQRRCDNTNEAHSALGARRAAFSASFAASSALRAARWASWNCVAVRAAQAWSPRQQRVTKDNQAALGQPVAAGGRDGCRTSGHRAAEVASLCRGGAEHNNSGGQAHQGDTSGVHRLVGRGSAHHRLRGRL